MLGLAKASEYAGWWNQNQAVVLRDEVTVTSTVPQRFMVAPRYYADMTGSTDNTSQSAVSMVSATGTTAIDMSGVPNQPKRSVTAVTMRVGSNWMTTAPTTGFASGGTWYNVLSNSSSESYFGAGISLNNNVYQIGAPTGLFPALTLTPSQLNTYRNRWLGIIVASSDSTSTFTNWSGTGTNTYNWASRTMLVDIENNTIVSRLDAYATSAVPSSIDLTQTYNLGYNSGTYWVNPFYYTNGTNQYYRYDCNVASAWFTIGETMDPLSTYPQLLGSGVGGSANGSRAWVVGGSNGVGTTVGTTLQQDIGTWGNSRMPDARIFLAWNTGETPSVFTSF